MAAYVGQTALTALWNKVVAVLAGKADRNSVYSKAEVDYKLATTYGSSSGGGGDTSDCVHLAGTETVTGSKTFSGSNSFSGNLTITSGTNTQYSGTMTYASSVLKVRSTSTSYSATIANAASANKTINLPTGSGTTHYLVSRTSTSLTSGQLTAWDGTAGILKNSGYTVATSVSNSSTTIPTSAAVKSYVDSNSGGGSSEWYNIRPDAIRAGTHANSGGKIGVTIDNYTTDPPGSSIKFFWMTYHKGGANSFKRSWHIPYLGYLNGGNNSGSKPSGWCSWNVSGAFTQLWGGTYSASQIYNGVSGHGGGSIRAVFGVALFIPGTYKTCKRVSNIAKFKLLNSGQIIFSNKY